MGGLSAQDALELVRDFAGHPELSLMHVLLLQEIVTEPGVAFHEDHGWVIVYGKNEGDWRGTAIAYRSTGHRHANTKLLQGGIATSLTDQRGKKSVRYLSGHIPHHATIAQTEKILGAWGPTLNKARLVLGFDANETFTDPDDEGWRAHTGRGEAILEALAQHGLQCPPQALEVPSYHPYNTALRTRRLDYLAHRGGQVREGGVLSNSRHMARSDHDLVWATLGRPPPAKGPKPTWGSRRFRADADTMAAVRQPPPQADVHTAISKLALSVTELGRPSERFRESSSLKAARKHAHQAAGGAARQLWKQVSRQRKQEYRRWHGGLVADASTSHWGAYRALNQLKHRVGWEHQLTDQPRWQRQLANHFQSIFAKATAATTTRRIGGTRRALEVLCKHTPWRPFTHDDLQLATRTWKNNKATGPDGVTHELLRLLMREEAWGDRILHMLNDFLYRGSLPELAQQGATILLPKTQGDPPTWGDTRPITLSSAILKWFAQLLLLRGGARIQRDAPCQWAGSGKQAPELLVVLRRVVRHAKEWGVPTWIVKLDIRKAFDSVWQESMGDMVAARVGGLRPGGGGSAGGMPWEARAWLGLLEAREMRIAVGDTITSIPQTNGVRQGSPDSPILFSRIVADCLEGALRETSHMLHPSKGPPPPESGGAFMDDTYLWSHDPAHLQALLAALERRLAAHGLTINPVKTAIIHSRPEGGGFVVGGKLVPCKPFGEVIIALGSPLTFGEGVAAIIAEMQHRARKAFHKHSKLLCAPTPLKGRIKLHQTLVRGAALWGGQSWPITDGILKAINSTQLNHIRRMMHPARRPGETWDQWHIRTMRGARVALHQSQVVRWSTFQSVHTWDLYGHMARAAPGGRPMLRWKDLVWWEAEKQKPRRDRHTHVKYNAMADPERQLVAVGGQDWKQIAADLHVWSHLRGEFVTRFDVPWATGRQGSIGNLTPNATGGNRGHAVANEALQLTA